MKSTLIKIVCITVVSFVVISIFFNLLIIFYSDLINLKIYNPNFIEKLKFIFFEYENWENIISPTAVIFTGLSSVATLWLIHLQMQIIKEQNKLSKKSNFVDWMGQMFASRYNIMDSILSYTGDDYLGRKSFQRSNRIINISLRIYNNEEVDIDCYSSAERSLYKKLLEDNSKTLCDVLELIDKQIDKMTGYTLNSYFHNIYATLKIIHQDTTLTYDEKKNYLLMYRSQFTQQELKTIYIHALFYKDSDGNKKFKDIIEKTSFFQSINSIALKKYVLGKLPEDFTYKEGAFNPDQANR